MAPLQPPRAPSDEIRMQSFRTLSRLQLIFEFRVWIEYLRDNLPRKYDSPVILLWDCMSFGAPICTLLDLLGSPTPRELQVYADTFDFGLEMDERKTFIESFIHRVNMLEIQGKIPYGEVLTLDDFLDGGVTGYTKVLRTVDKILSSLQDSYPGVFVAPHGWKARRSALINELKEAEQAHVSRLSKVSEAVSKLYSDPYIQDPSLEHFIVSCSRLIPYHNICFQELTELPPQGEEIWDDAFMFSDRLLRTNIIRAYHLLCSNYLPLTTFLASLKPFQSNYIDEINLILRELSGILGRISEYRETLQEILELSTPSLGSAHAYDSLCRMTFEMYQLSQTIDEAGFELRTNWAGKQLKTRLGALVPFFTGEGLGMAVLDDRLIVDPVERTAYSVILFQSFIICCREKPGRGEVVHRSEARYPIKAWEFGPALSASCPLGLVCAVPTESLNTIHCIDAEHFELFWTDGSNIEQSLVFWPENAPQYSQWVSHLQVFVGRILHSSSTQDMEGDYEGLDSGFVTGGLNTGDPGQPEKRRPGALKLGEENTAVSALRTGNFALNTGLRTGEYGINVLKTGLSTGGQPLRSGFLSVPLHTGPNSALSHVSSAHGEVDDEGRWRQSQITGLSATPQGEPWEHAGNKVRDSRTSSLVANMGTGRIRDGEGDDDSWDQEDDQTDRHGSASSPAYSVREGIEEVPPTPDMPDILSDYLHPTWDLDPNETSDPPHSVIPMESIPLTPNTGGILRRVGETDGDDAAKRGRKKVKKVPRHLNLSSQSRSGSRDPGHLLALRSAKSPWLGSAVTKQDLALDMQLLSARLPRTPANAHWEPLNSARFPHHYYGESPYSRHYDVPLKSALKSALKSSFSHRQPNSAYPQTEDNDNDNDTLDLTGDVERKGTYAVAHGGHSDIWRGIWNRRVQRNPKKVVKWATSPSSASVDSESGKDEEEDEDEDEETEAFTVAVKVLRNTTDDPDKKAKLLGRLHHELLVWTQLSHPHVLPLYGIVNDFGPYPSMVCPWMENGSVSRYMERSGDTLGVDDRLRIISEVVEGLEYLHQCSVIHGDLTGSNVLLDSNLRAQVCDFGLSAIVLAPDTQNRASVTSYMGGAIRWTDSCFFENLDVLGLGDSEAGRAGETTEDGEFEWKAPSLTYKSDVYSFGCVMLEILSGRPPYHYIALDAQVIIELHKGHKPRRPAKSFVDDGQWELIQWCWMQPPEERPEVREVGVKLREILDGRISLRAQQGDD